MRRAFLCGDDRIRRRNIIAEVVSLASAENEITNEKDMIDFIMLVVEFIIDTTNTRMWTESYLATYICMAFTTKEVSGVKFSPLKDAIMNKQENAPYMEYLFDCTEILSKVDDAVVFQTLDVIKWDVMNNCTDEYERNLTLNKIPDKDKVGKEPGRQWRVLMNYAMELGSMQEREVYFRLALNMYQKERQALSNKDKIFNLIYGVYYYLIERRPLAEHTYENVIKLLGAAKKVEKLVSSPFAKIIEQEYRANPFDKEFSNIRGTLKNINNNDVDDALEFMRWDILKKDPIDKDEILGYTTIMGSFITTNVMMEHDENYSNKADIQPLNKDIFENYKEFAKNYTPASIKNYLDEYIIGQDSAKKNVSSAVYNHILRGLYPDKKLNKSNVLLIGPSGCGKTEIIRRLKDMFSQEGINIPIVISDFSGVVATPWKGRNKEEILARLFDEADKDIERAQRGIVFLDEFDKIIPEVAGGARGYDYNSELQGQMLGMLEGTSCQVKVQLRENGKDFDANILMRTDNILFILAGAFDGLDEVIRKSERANQTSTFGMVSNKKSHIDFSDENVTIDNLMSFGLRAELAGRIGYVSVLKPLLKEDMIRILKEAKDNIISKYQNAMYAEDGIILEFEEDAYSALADKVQEFNIGARGLNAILHDVLSDVMFKAPSIPGIEKVIITGDKVNGTGDAIYVTSAEE